MALKVFDLACEHEHVFEGWFRSHDDYEQQLKSGWLLCPICNSKTIYKKLSAPRLNLRHGVNQGTAAAAQQGMTDASTEGQFDVGSLQSLQAELLQKIKQVIKNTDDVGDNFASEARKIHEGEVPERAIRGSATPEEYESLREDGIRVLAIPEFLDEEKLN